VVLAQRQDARARKDFAAADAIRDGLDNIGIRVEDTVHGVRWSLDD
jgi:cysteinyl-tRNA synthetase